MAENKIKVCILLRSHPSAAMGGAPYQGGIIAEQLASYDEFDVHYLASRVDPNFSHDSYQIHQFGNPDGPLSRRSTIFDYFALRKALKKLDADVVYQNALTAHTGFSARFAKGKDRKFIYHIASDFDVMPHSFLSKGRVRIAFEWLDKQLAKFTYKHADGILAQTQKQADLLKQNFGRDDAVVFSNLLPYPDTIAEKQNQPLQVVWVANFKAVKQPEVFYELARHFEHDDRFEFKMIGKAALEMGYQKLHDDIKQLNNIEYLGELPIDEVDQLLEHSHVLVNTSVTEGLSNTFIQAWMREVPVLSLHADVDGMLERNELGMLGGNFEQLCAKLDLMGSDTALRTGIGKRAREYSERKNSLKNISVLADLIRA